MKKKGDAFLLKGKLGDRININIQSEGTKHRVKYDLFGKVETLPEGQPLTIMRDKFKKMLVKIDLAYSQTQGGIYYIEVEGSGGVSSRQVLKQMHGEQNKSICFGLEGDDTTDLSEE